MKKVELHIADMQSMHCQTRVTKIIQSVDGVVIEQVLPKVAVFISKDEEAKQQVVSAIERDGYTVRESVSSTHEEQSSEFNIRLQSNAFLS